MIKKLLMLAFACLAVSVTSAQDFVQLFMDEHPNDTTINCITISPKMMQEILKSEAHGNEHMREIIAGLKSMQIVASTDEGETYYDSALETVRRNSDRYEPFASFNSDSEDYQIMVRKKNDEIVEMIMMLFKNQRFAVINFTGKIKTEFISTLARSIAQDKL